MERHRPHPVSEYLGDQPALREHAGRRPCRPFTSSSTRAATETGPLNTAPFAAAPYNQPADVIAALTSGNWCNPPGAGLGLRPTANTGVALLDAYLWVKTPGRVRRHAATIADGARRAWDYTQYNPWNVTGAAQSTWDPLWGMVDPAAGLWFTQQALQLAQNATPPLL